MFASDEDPRSERSRSQPQNKNVFRGESLEALTLRSREPAGASPGPKFGIGTARAVRYGFLLE